jgi:hypothetical protein
VCDLEARTVVAFVAEDRRAESLSQYYRSLTAEQHTTLRAVAIDMSAYIPATRDELPDGDTKIGFTGAYVGMPLPVLLAGSMYAHLNSWGMKGLSPGNMAQELGEWPTIAGGYLETTSSLGCHVR